MHPIDTSKPPVRLGLIGYGPWGRNLFRELDSLSDASVVAVCDADPNRLAQLRSSTPDLFTTSSISHFLSECSIDGVLIATPPSSHYEPARRSLQADKHVYVEKLLGLCADQARELDELARSHARILMVGHVCLHDPAVERLAREVEAGLVGSLRHIRSIRTSLGRFQAEVNVVWDLAPHDLSMLKRVVGRLPDEVAVQARAFVSPREEVATVLMSYDSGPTVELCLSWLDAHKQRSWTVIGSEGTLTHDALEPNEPLRFRRASIEQAEATDGASRRYLYREGEQESLLVQSGEARPLARLGQHFVECMKSGSLPATGGPEGAAILGVLEACDRSLAAGGLPVRVAPRH